jgi:Zn-dependent peptidase ImmA (M78 family)/DNA-binding XRE family transcriptional regulator
MFNSSRLTLARRRRRLTSKALAELIAMSPVTVTRLERANNEPEPETVDAIARALRYPRDFFFGDDLDVPPKDAASFRSLTAMTAGEREAALAAGALAYLLADWVATRFNLPPPDLIDASHERDPAKAARWLRQHWALGEQPISNMVKLLEAKGVRVFSLAENTRNVDAFSCWRDGVPYVFLNTWKSAEHSRFDASHELGHLVLHRHGGPQQGRSAELEAHLFAASFLMPEADVKSKIPYALSLDQIVVAKRRWGVSVSALAYRLHKLGIISSWLYRGMVIEIGRRGYRTAEPNGLAREESLLWKKVLSDLWHDRITKAHIAAELRLPSDEVENLVFGLNGMPGARLSEMGEQTGRPSLRLV